MEHGMMKMASMMRKPDKKGAQSVGPEDKPYFPHSLYLDKDDIEKMGLGDAKMGEERMMMAKVRVSGMSESKGMQGTHRSMNVEFMEGAMEKTKDTKPAAERIYGGGHGGGKQG